MAADAGRALNGMWGTAVITGLICLLVGTVSGRPDIAALAAPFILLAAAGLQNLSLRTHAEPAATDAAASGKDAHVRFRSQGKGTIGVVTAVVPGFRSTGLIVPDSGPPSVVVAGRPLSGRATILTYTSTDLCALGVTTRKINVSTPLTQTVLPPVTTLSTLPLPHRLTGRTGEHTARLPGTGAEFRGLYPFAPGDELRRIDWRATARQPDVLNQLMVRGTHAESEATITLVVDTGADYPAETASWFSTTARPLTKPASLHLSRMGATAVAASYLAHGDRVGLAELTGLSKPLRALSGRRQLELLRARLAQYSTLPRSERTQREQQIPAGSLVILFSPFMDDAPAEHMLRWHRLGHRVIGVDVLPHLAHTTTDAHEQTAVRLSMLQRALVLRDLRRAGLTVVGYRGEKATGSKRTSATALDDVGGQLDLATGLAVLRKTFARSPGSRAVRSR